MPVLGGRGDDRRRARPPALLTAAVAAEMVAGLLYLSGARPGSPPGAGRPTAAASGGTFTHASGGRSSSGRTPSGSPTAAGTGTRGGETTSRTGSASSTGKGGTGSTGGTGATGAGDPAGTGTAGTGTAGTGTAGTGTAGPGSASPDSANPGSGPTGSGGSTGQGTSGSTTSGSPAATPGTGPGGPSSAAGGGSQVPAVQCRTDLPLAQAPDAPYDFLCEQGSTPVTWSTNRIIIFQSGLTVLQSTSLSLALVQWELDSRFQVAFTAVRADANVTITGAPLSAGQPGYVEDGYTTVSYRCTPLCSYDSAAVELSTAARLLQSDWEATILHELGHVAGLNHVSRDGEVMYPYLTALSPAVYAAGDVAGLDVLARERGA